MSKKSGRTVVQVKEKLARLAVLFSAVIHAINQKQRAEDMVQGLLRALDLFKSDKLAAVMSRDEVGQQRRREDRFRSEQAKKTERWIRLVRLMRLREHPQDRDLSVEIFLAEREDSKPDILETVLPGLIRKSGIRSIRQLVQMTEQQLREMLWPADEPAVSRRFRGYDRVEMLAKHFDYYGLEVNMSGEAFDDALNVIEKA